jgi:hypothetical protein
MNDMFLNWKLNNQDNKLYCYLCYRENSTDSVIGCLGCIPTQFSPKDGLVFLEQAMANFKKYGLPKKIKSKLEEEIVNKVLSGNGEFQGGTVDRKKRYAIPTAWSFVNGEVQTVGYCMHDEP